MKGYTHERFYPKTPEAWINWYVGESENRTIQSVIRSDKCINDPTLKQVNYNGYVTYRKIKPSKCLCHNTNYHTTKNTKSRKIYDGLSSSSKCSLSGIFNKLDLIQSTRKRISNRIYHINNIENESLYHKKRNAEIRIIVLTAYAKGSTPYCECCNACHTDVLALDHINGGGNKHRKALRAKGETSNLYAHLYRHFKKTGKWLSGYQLLCTTCNWIKFVRGSCTPVYHKKLSVPQQTSGVI